MDTRNYKRFVPQQDGISTIRAEDINDLQRTVEETQQQLFVQGDMTFLAKCLFALEHHPEANAMMVDLLEDISKINLASSVGVSYDPDMNSLLLDGPENLEGGVSTKLILNETGKPYRKLVFLTDEYKPVGTSISYEVSYDGITYYPIQANQALPLVIEGATNQVTIRMTFKRSSFDVTPRVDAWALMYEDETYVFRFLDNGLNIGIDAGWDGTIVR